MGHHCETDWDKLCITKYMGQIFSDDAGKKCDKCIQMHYIGKSYVTTAYKCDDGKIDRFLGQIFSDDSEKKVWQVYTNALYREKLCNHCI